MKPTSKLIEKAATDDELLYELYPGLRPAESVIECTARLLLKMREQHMQAYLKSYKLFEG